MPAAIHRRALQRALELSGGAEPLARHLGVAPSAVRFWLNASSPLPGDIFLKIVDLVLEHQGAPRPPGPDA